MTDILSLQDERQIFTWNQKTPKSIDVCTHELIREQFLSRPHAPAVCSWDGNLTYTELEELSSRFARYLSIIGVGPRVLVPLLFSKSKWTIVAMIAVLKSGGAVVPLAPSMPRDRVKAIVCQTNAKLALASQDCVETYGTLFDSMFVVNAESISNLLNHKYELDQPLSIPDPSSIAYVLFTSGSTGVPKGAIIEHRSLSTSAVSSGPALGFEGQSRTLQFSSYTFDVSILEIIWTLVWGGCVCVPSEQQRMDSLIDTMNGMEVTLAFFTPSLLDILPLGNAETLTTIITGGEKPSPSTVQRLSGKFRIIPVYGPCECSVISSAFDTSKRTFQLGDLGTPVGCRFWIVRPDDFNQLSPIGEVGEILIEGPIVGRGYLADGEKTKAAFVQNPHWATAQNNGTFFPMYRTGDLAKYTRDGEFCFVGRKDNQVKLRGQRFELDEVEVHLRGCFSNTPYVPRGIALIASPSGIDVPLLVAFILFDGDDTAGYLDWDKKDGPSIETSPAQQQRFASLISHGRTELMRLLPGYAVPTFYIPLRSAPLTMNGKIDRKRLQQMVSAVSAEEIEQFQTPAPEYQPPSSSMEKRLQELWRPLLGVPDIGVNDNFFRLGGNSLLAMQLSTTARTEGLSLTTDTIFVNPVLVNMARATVSLSKNEDLEVAQLSLFAEEERGQILEQAALQCQMPLKLIEDVYPTTPQQSFFIHGGINSGSFQRQSVYLLPKSLDLERFIHSWEILATTFEILRTWMVYHLSKSGYLQVVVKKGLRWRRGKSLKDDLEQEDKHIMGVGEPLYRFGLIEDDELDQKYLVLSVQHAVYDAWSLTELFQKLEYVYKNGSCPVPELKHNRFIKWVLELDRDAAITFWKSYLADVDTKAFGTAGPDQPVFCDSTRTRHVSLENYLHNTWAVSTRVHVALAITIANLLDCHDVIFEVFGNGRSVDLAGVEVLMAPTLTAYALRVHINPSDTILELATRIQEDLGSFTKFGQFNLQNIAKISPEISRTCMNAIRLNVLPTLTAPAATQLHLPVIWGQSAISRQLRLTCTITPTGISLEAAFDKHIIPSKRADELLRKFELAFHQVSVASEDQTVSDIDLRGFEALTDSDILESITQKSQAVRSRMLVS